MLPCLTGRPCAEQSRAAYLSAVAEIVAELVSAYKEKKTLNLSRLKAETSSRYGLSTIPTLVDIMAGIPEQHRAELVPYLRVKPIRTASGIAVVVRTGVIHHVWPCLAVCSLPRVSSGRHVQAPSLPSHRVDRQRVCVLPRGPRLRLRVFYPGVHRVSVGAAKPHAWGGG